MSTTRNSISTAAAVIGFAMLPGLALAQETASPSGPPPVNAVGAGGDWGAQVATEGAAAPAAEPALDAKQAEAVKKVSAYFNALGNLKGSFMQTGPDNKRMKGKFYVKRPGRFRFDYSLPSKQIIISDGVYLAIQDLDLNNEDRFSLDQTPFRLLLRDDVDLARDAKITDVRVEDGLIVLTLQDKDPDAPGKIKLSISAKPELAIREWTTTDAQGLDTRVEVSELVKGEEVDAALFKIQPVGLTPKLAQ